MSRRMICWSIAMTLGLGLVSHNRALGFGDNGHIAVAMIADLNLSPAAKAKLAELLGTDKHIYDRSIAMWADVYKFTSPGAHTKNWHFVDIPLAANNYDAGRDCHNDDCVVARIEEQRKILADHSKPKAERLMALKFLVHLVGDAHQPLHACDNNDQGGNAVAVRFLNRREGHLNLHHIWDSEILDENMQGADPEDYAKHLNAQLMGPQKANWAAVTQAEQWVLESHKEAQAHAYLGIPPSSSTSPHHPVEIDQLYYKQAAPIVDQQVAKAGIRLAALLNSALP